jgi:ACT domain-containing protein
MKSISKASRVNNAFQVIHHMHSGMSVVDACRAVGMPRSSFYYIVDNNPETIAEAQAIIEANNREQLGLILASKNEILRKVIDAGLA